MEILGILALVLLFIVVAATVSELLHDGRGHTPPVTSEEAWSASDLPSINYSLRIF